MFECCGSAAGSCCDLRQHECQAHNRGLNNKCYDDCMCEDGESDRDALVQCAAQIHIVILIHITAALLGLMFPHLSNLFPSLIKGFVATPNSTGSGASPGGGAAAWCQSRSAATREASSPSDEEEAHERKEREEERRPRDPKTSHDSASH